LEAVQENHQFHQRPVVAEVPDLMHRGKRAPKQNVQTKTAEACDPLVGQCPETSASIGCKKPDDLTLSRGTGTTERGNR